MSVSTCAGLCASGAIAQEAAPAADTSAPVELPKLTVETKAQAKSKQKKKVVQKAPAAAAPVQATQQQPDTRDAAGSETATGPVNGIVATRSATGTKTDTPLIETPQSVSVVTADRIEQGAFTTINEALGYTAGVAPSIFGVDMRYDWLSIRGFDAYQPGFFIDGMLSRNNNTWSVWRVEPYGSERVEVLKGPPSVLYGQANTGGMINVISKRPLDEPLNEVQVRIGSHERLETDFDFSGPATPDGSVLYRLTGVVVDTETEVDFTEQKEVYIAPSLTWRPTAGTSLTVLGQYRNDDTVPSAGTYLPNPHAEIRPSLFVGEPGFDNFDREQWSVGYLFDHRVDSIWTVRQNLRFASIDVDYAALFAAFSPDEATLFRTPFTSVETTHLFTVDNQAEAKFVTGNVKHTLLAGVDYQRGTYDQKSGSAYAAGPTLDLNNPVYGADVADPLPYNDSYTVLSQTGLYLQEQAKIAERLIVTLGGRYDWASTDYDDRLFAADTEKSDEAFTWRGAVLYRDPSGLAPYYSYSESFFPQGTVNPLTGTPFDPETGQQHEVGIKFEPNGFRGLFTLAAFDITRQNYVTYDNTPKAEPHATGEIRSRGIEFEATAEPLPGLDVTAAYTWLPTFDVEASSNQDEIGQRMPMVAEHSGSVWIHYQLQEGALRGLGFGGGVRYIGETYGDIANTNFMKVPDYTLFDAVVDYEIDDWRLALNVSNIADEETIKCNDVCYIGAGRNVIGTIRRRW